MPVTRPGLTTRTRHLLRNTTLLASRVRTGPPKAECTTALADPGERCSLDERWSPTSADLGFPPKPAAPHPPIADIILVWERVIPRSEAGAAVEVER